MISRRTKPLNPPGLASLFVQSRVYQMSVTLPALVVAAALWILIVSALAIWMSTILKPSMYTMWIPGVEADPEVMAAVVGDSKPTHSMKPLGIRSKLT
jgi:hypothetical protein